MKASGFAGGWLLRVNGAGGDSVEAEVSMESAPAVLYDALVLPDGERGNDVLSQSGQVMEFVRDQYRHCKPILALGASRALLEKAGIALPSAEVGAAGVLSFSSDALPEALSAFTQALAKHRHFERETDPPMI